MSTYADETKAEDYISVMNIITRYGVPPIAFEEIRKAGLPQINQSNLEDWLEVHEQFVPADTVKKLKQYRNS